MSPGSATRIMRKRLVKDLSTFSLLVSLDTTLCHIQVACFRIFILMLSLFLISVMHFHLLSMIVSYLHRLAIDFLQKTFLIPSQQDEGTLNCRNNYFCNILALFTTWYSFK